MARKTKNFTATVGRDAGKVFVLTEMPASQAEKWAIRCLLALGHAGVTVPDEFAQQGMAGMAQIVAAIGLRAVFGLHYAEAEPLLDEMMACVQFNPGVATRALIEEDIEEVQTRLQIRDEVVALHLGFSIAAELQKWGEASKRALSPSPTRTSGRSRAPSSPRGKRAS